MELNTGGLSNKNWTSTEEAKPDIQLCIDSHSIYFISNPIRIKTKTGYDFIARYKVLMMDYIDIYYMKELWKICGLDFEITNNEVVSWQELLDKYEGE
ncbi:MAG: hypothetical protein BHW64_01360 [Candidatus Melainabacteria bacterium LEY3_CP_29_8]|nr:MAG: hypothetical protein BHW64_01360 [Candidatus Melainabacteria bacterium LEY3_CP_29_8]